MMKFVLIFFAISMSALPAAAQVDPITIHDAHAFQTVTVQKNGAAYLRIDNIADEGDRVIAAEADVSERIELHTHLMEDGVMMMREVPYFALAPKGEIVLEPMGDHIMFMNLKAPLKVGQSFPMTLVFERAGRKETIVEVRSIKDMHIHMDHDAKAEKVMEESMEKSADSQKLMYKKPVSDGLKAVSEEVIRE